MSKIAHSSDKLMELIEINSIIEECNPPEMFEMLNLANNQKYVQARLKEQGLFHDYINWNYLNIK